MVVAAVRVVEWFFVGKMCVFASRPMKIVTFLRNNDYTPKRVVDFPLERDTFRNKIMEIVKDFDEKSYNNNGKPWKSSRILRVNLFFHFSFSFHLFSLFFRLFFHSLSFSFIFLSFSFIFLHFLSFSFIFLFIFSHFLSLSFIVFHFLSFSFTVFHFLSFSFIFVHFLSFSFIFFDFLSFSFSFCRVLKI